MMDGRLFFTRDGMDMDMVLDELIYGYTIDNYTPQLSDELFRSFELLFVFDKGFNDSEFVELVMDKDNQDNENLKDIILAKLKAKINYVLAEHTIKLQPETDFFICNEILSSLLLLQSLDDYTDVATILESQLDKEEKLATVIAYTSTLRESDVYPVLDSFSEDLITSILSYIYEQEKTNGEKSNDLVNKILKKLQLLKSFIAENTALGITLVKHNIRIGEPFNMYLSHIVDHLASVKSIPQKALDVLSVLMISSDGYNLPLISFRKYSNLLSMDLITISKIDAAITSILGDFEKHILDIENAKTKLPEVSYSV